MNAIVEVKPFELVLADYKEDYQQQLDEYKKKYVNVVYDLNDPVQEKQARADRLAIGKVVSALDKEHRVIKSPMETDIKLLDSTRKEIKDDLLLVQEGIKAQLKQHDEAIVRHCAKLQKLIDDINLFADVGVDTAFTLTDRLKQVKRIKVDESFENREADGHMAKAKVTETLEGMIALEEKRAKEAAEAELKAEAERIKAQQERDAEIRKEVEAKAKKDAEVAAKKVKDDAKAAQDKATKDAKDTAAKAEQDRMAAKNKADKEKQAAVDKVINDAAEVQKAKDILEKKKLAEAEKEAAALKAKQENKEHQAKIHNETLGSLLGLEFVDGVSSEEKVHICKELVKAIVRGEIKNVTIDY